MLKRMKSKASKKGVPSFHFEFAIQVHAVEFTIADKKWKPESLVFEWKRNQRVATTKPVNEFKTTDANVFASFHNEELLMLVNLTKDSNGSFEGKDFKFSLEDVRDKKSKKLLARLVVDLSKYVNTSGKTFTETLTLWPESVKVSNVRVPVTIACRFVSEGTKDDDEVSISGNSFKSSDASALDSDDDANSTHDGNPFDDDGPSGSHADAHHHADDHAAAEAPPVTAMFKKAGVPSTGTVPPAAADTAELDRLRSALDAIKESSQLEIDSARRERDEALEDLKRTTARADKAKEKHAKELEAAKAEKDKLQEELVDLKAKNETLGKEKKDLTAQVVALQNAASAKEDQPVVPDTAKALAALEAANQSLKKELDAVHSDLARSESALQTAKSEGVSLAAAANRSQAEAESRVTQAKSEAAKSKAEADRLRAEVDKLKGDLDKADKAKAELRSTLDKGTHSEAASQTALQAQIERLRADLEHAMAEKAAAEKHLESERVGFDAHIKALEEKVAGAKQPVDAEATPSREVARLKADKDALETKLKERDVLIEKYRAQEEELEEESITAAKELGQAKAKIAQLEAQAAKRAQEDMQSGSSAEIDSAALLFEQQASQRLKKQLDEKSREVETLNGKLHTLERQLGEEKTRAEMAGKLAKRRETEHDDAGKVAKLEERIASLERDLAQARAHAGKRDEDSDEEDSDEDSDEDSASSLKQRLKTLQNQLKSTQRELDAAESDLDREKAAHLATQEELDHITEDLQALQKGRKVSSGAAGDGAGGSWRLKQEMEELTSMLIIAKTALAETQFKADQTIVEKRRVAKELAQEKLKMLELQKRLTQLEVQHARK